MEGQCKQAPKRLKWAGLIAMRDTKLGVEAREEMIKLGATTMVVFGTVGETMHSELRFRPL